MLGLPMLCLSVIGCMQGPPPMPAPPPSKVTVSVPIEHQVTDYADFTGQTAAIGMVEIRARVWGYLDKVNFREGALVKKGDLLYQIDPRPYQAAVDQSQGKVAQDEAQLKHVDATYRRYLQLRKTGAVTQEDIDKTLADRDTAAATLQADKGDLDQRQLDLDFTRITAPISGRVSRTEVTEGNVVQSGQTGGTLLTTIVTVDPIYVYFDVDERSLLQVRRSYHEAERSASAGNVPVYMGLVDEDDFPHFGTVNFVDNKVDAGTGTLRLRGVFQNADGLFSPGLFVRVRLPIGVPHRAILVAEQALGSDQEQKFVYVVDTKNEVNYRAVKTGRLYGGLRVIESGLATGEKVVVNGLQRVRPGAKVEPKLAEMPHHSVTASTNSSPKKRVAGN
jgi:RND family efflux transporter MFP subunit